MNSTRVIQFGCGPIGLASTRYLIERDGVELVAGIDTDPGLAGRDMGTLAGLAQPLGVSVSSDAERILRNTTADVVLLTTCSELQRVEPQILRLVEAGLHVISTCEELAYPWFTHPEIARRIDAAARGRHVAVLGTGVNPGFLMDFLPIVTTGICRRVDTITAERIQDASSRREPFQRKIGAGLSPEVFDAKRKSGEIRHVGLTESMHMIAATLGLAVEQTEETIQPIIAKQPCSTEYLEIPAGHARGLCQVACAYREHDAVISLIFRAAVGEPEPRDRVIVSGCPNLQVEIPGGAHGDIATCTILVNAISTVLGSPPGLRTMADVGLVRWTPGVRPLQGVSHS